jgi:hypothetical protein
MSYKKPMGKIMGINFSFQGAVAVAYVRLTDKENKVVYEDDFIQKEENTYRLLISRKLLLLILNTPC